MALHRYILGALALAGLTSARPGFCAPEVTLYRGETAASQGISLGGWGSGKAVESQKENFSGSNSISVITDGYYAGARIDFQRPVDLLDAFSEKDGYLVFMLRFPSLPTDEETLGGGGGGVGPGGGRPLGIPPGGRPLGIPPGGGGAGTAASTDQTGPLVSFIRVAAVVNGITLVAEDQPIDTKRTEAGWTTVSFPLSAFKGRLPGGSAMLSRLIVTGDRPDFFYIGEIRTSLDENEIILEEEPEEQTVNPYDLTTLTVNATGGLANLEYVWDFDSKDGIQEDALGETVTHTWREPGTYTVTLRIRDINGVKAETKLEIPVVVAQ